MSSVFSFIAAFSEVGAADSIGDELSTSWQILLGVAGGIALIVLALIVGSVVQRRGTARDEARKAELRAAADDTGPIRLTDLDLSDDSDFDLGQPQPPSSVPSADVPELL